MLYVEKKGDLIKMNLPSQNPIACNMPELLKDGLGSTLEACYFNEDYVVVFKDEKDIVSIQPDFQKLKMLNSRGVITTASSEKYDFVSRAFFTKYSILEDPVTGFAYTKLIPYCLKELVKQNLIQNRSLKEVENYFVNMTGKECLSQAMLNYI